MVSRRYLVPICVVVLMAVPACGESTGSPRAGTPSASAAPSADDTEAVRAAFNRYKEAALAADGEAAAEVLASTTYAFYDSVRNAALSATEQELAAMPPVERLTAVIMRGSLPADVLRSSTPEQLMAAAVEAGLIGEAGTNNVEIGEVTVSGETARATAIVRGAAAPFDLTFVREVGAWKFDLLPLLELGRIGLEEAAKEQGVTVDQLIAATLTQKYGREKYSEIVSRPVGR